MPRDLVVVLGHAGRDGSISASARARLRAAARHALANAPEAVVLAGGSPRGQVPEAVQLRAEWTLDVPVITEEQSTITAENAYFARHIALRLGVDRVVVVTSWWHAPRAWLLFRVAFRGSGVAVGVVAAPDRAGRIRALFEPGLFLRAPRDLRRARRLAEGEPVEHDSDPAMADD